MDSKEEKIFEVNPSMAPQIPSIAILAFIGFVFLLGIAQEPVLFLISLVFFGAAAYQYFIVKFTLYTLTNEKLIIKKGIVSMFKQTIPVNKIQDVTVIYGLIQRIFGCGDVVVDTAGTYKNSIIRNIANPDEVAEKILSLLHKNS